MPRAGLSPDAVVDAALELIDDRGPEALTLAAVAAHAGVATPSLYKHISSLAELRTLLAVRVTDQLVGAVSHAALGRSGSAAIAAVMREWRRYALRHPRRYLAMPQSADGDPRWTRAGERLVELMYAILKGCDIADSDAVHLVRGVRATVHGFVVIELSGGYQLAEDVDDSYERLIATLTASLP